MSEVLNTVIKKLKCELINEINICEYYRQIIRDKETIIIEYKTLIADLEDIK
jgi:hypothetical protein